MTDDREFARQDALAADRWYVFEATVRIRATDVQDARISFSNAEIKHDDEHLAPGSWGPAVTLGDLKETYKVFEG